MVRAGNEAKLDLALERIPDEALAVLFINSLARRIRRAVVLVGAAQALVDLDNALDIGIVVIPAHLLVRPSCSVRNGDGSLASQRSPQAIRTDARIANIVRTWHSGIVSRQVNNVAMAPGRILAALVRMHWREHTGGIELIRDLLNAPEVVAA